MSVVNDFVEVIESRLNNLTDVNVVVQTRQGGDQSQEYTQYNDRTIIVHALDVEQLPEYDRIGNPPAVGQALPILVTFITIPSEKFEAEAWIKQASENGSSAQNAITDPANWHTIGGNAIDAVMGAVKFNRPSDESFGSVYFTVLVKYRVNETNFETLRA